MPETIETQETPLDSTKIYINGAIVSFNDKNLEIHGKDGSVVVIPSVSQKSKNLIQNICKTIKEHNSKPIPTSIEIQWPSVITGSLSEIYSSGLQYAFVSDDNRLCHKLVYCKDFLQDAVQAHVHKKSNSIYNFSYKHGENPPISESKIRLLLTNRSDNEFSSKIPAVIEFINQIEYKLKIDKTKSVAIRVTNPPKNYINCGMWLFEGSRRWLVAGPMLSMYTLFLRIGFLHKTGTDYTETIKKLENGTIQPYQRNDKSYFVSSKSAVEKILEKNDKSIFWSNQCKTFVGQLKKNYPEKVDVSTMHNYYGICSFAAGNTAFPQHWKG